MARARRGGEASGIAAVLTHATDPIIEQLLDHQHATRIPGAAYLLPVRVEAPAAGDVARGARFHAELFARMPHAEHADDPAHDAAVGQAIRLGVLEQQPVRAARLYNAWAVKHGYAPIRFLGRTDAELYWKFSADSASVFAHINP